MPATPYIEFHHKIDSDIVGKMYVDDGVGSCPVNSMSMWPQKWTRNLSPDQVGIPHLISVFTSRPPFHVRCRPYVDNISLNHYRYSTT